MHGDGDPEMWVLASGLGSPPRAWGRLHRHGRVEGDGRITPTCMGTALRRSWRVVTASDHPHVHGDGTSQQTDLDVFWGSPPRAWGRQRFRVGLACIARITPTCMGTAPECSPPTSWRWDHPHVHGDGAARTYEDVPYSGSPPRAWGRPGPRQRRRSLRGITPTCMGTATAPRTASGTSRDHPHVHGDGTAGSGDFPTDAGSPPRAWGRLRDHHLWSAGAGITPTCMGTATGISGWTRSPRDHPHVHGDGSRNALSDRASTGSPPRAWGRRTDALDALVDRRITPTCMGTAVGYVRIARSNWDHPHVHGDGRCCLTQVSSTPGSPPRAWGRHHLARSRVQIRRITPTCMGTAANRRAARRASGGSPPRAWGRRHPARPRRDGVGITPTCMGTARRGPPRARQLGDHPHVHGDGEGVSSSRGGSGGSPPRAWGRRRMRSSSSMISRITPTCMGTAGPGGPRTGTARDHPHVHGDGQDDVRSILWGVGSPPRAWGRRLLAGDGGRPHRITPTCMGTASSPPRPP
ncbi:hypothetical protein SAMN05428996_0014 [Quadrisphaera sp. DSM 44207]|nr:hypothetical protein SAMN05428996_0014 [Quadrisphaera sp. DSM 44207]